MADEVVIARFQADISDLQKELDKYVKALEGVQKEEKDTQDQVKKTTTTETDAAKKRNAAIKAEINEIQKLKAARKQAFDPVVISGFTKKIQEAEGRIAALRGQTNNLGSSIKASLAGVGAGIAAAFSVGAVIQFGKASINAFLEAEENANRLKFAITEIGNEGEAAFSRLIEQSERLQKATIFSDDAIQQAQTALATMGLTSTQIEELIPRLADFASATKQDIVSAAQAVGSGLQGMGREFKKFGIEVNANNTTIENYNELLEGMVQFQGAASEATETLTGQLKQQENAADDLQEKVGQELAPAWVAVRKAVFEATLATIEFFKAGGNLAVSLLNQKLDELPGAFDEVTRKVKEQEKALIDAGFTQAEARKNAIRDIRAEINERLALRTEQARSIAADKEATIEEKQRAVNRIGAVKNELEAIKQLAEAEKSREADAARTLSREQLRLKSIEELNALLKENGELNDSISQSNVDLINREIAARKKQTEETEKELAKQLEALKKLNGDVKKLPPIELEAAFKETEVTPVNPVPEKLELPAPDTAKFNDGIQDAFDKTVAGWITANDEILSVSEELLGDLISLFNQFADQRIDRIEKERDTQLEAIDTQLEANEKALEQRRVSEKEFAENQKQLEESRAKAEADADKKVRAIKRKEFQADQIAALASIAIETAKNIAANPTLTAFYLAIAAAQGAIVAAQPNPYKKGTKKSKEGLALVGEEGPERMLLPQGTKILDAKKTKRYAEVFDAMHDDRFEDYVLKEFAAPILAKAKKNFMDQAKEKDNKSIAENMTRSMVINNMMSGKGDFFLERMDKRGITVKNIDELAEAIISKQLKSPYR